MQYIYCFLQQMETNEQIQTKQDIFNIGKNYTLFHSLVASEGYTPQLRFEVEVQ